MSIVRSRKFSFKRLKRLVIQVFRESGRNEIGLLSAGLAFYTILSLAPLLLVVVYAVGLVLGQEEARFIILDYLRQVFDPKTVELVASMIEGARRGGQGPGAAIVGGLLSILVGSRVFMNMQKALNALWEVETQSLGKLTNPWPLVRKRLIATGTVVFVSIVFLASILAQTALAAVTTFAVDRMPVSAPLWNLAHLAAVSLVASGVFAILYKILPDVEVRWRWVIGPAVAAAVSYVVISSGISRYLGYEATTSMTGAAGAVMALMTWIFVSAAAFLVGAQTCRVLADDDGYRPEQHPPPTQNPSTFG